MSGPSGNQLVLFSRECWCSPETKSRENKTNCLYHALHIWSVYASVQNWKLDETIFLRRIEWRPKKIVLILRILENAISLGKKETGKQKSHRSLFESLAKNTWKYMKLKYLDQLRKKTSIVSSWSRSHLPLDNCSLFIWHEEYKSQATSYK